MEAKTSGKLGKPFVVYEKNSDEEGYKSLWLMKVFLNKGIDMPKIVEKASFDRKYEGIPKFPAVTRDLSMVVPKHVLAGEIEEMIVQRGGKHLESFKLFDIYEGTQIKEGYKSMAYSVVFRAKDKTMEEAEITTVMKKILNGLESMGIELRQ